MLYTKKDLRVKRKYGNRPYVVSKGQVISASANKKYFRIIYYDKKTNKRIFRVDNSNALEFTYDSELDIYWTTLLVKKRRFFVYWSWPEDRECL